MTRQQLLDAMAYVVLVAVLVLGGVIVGSWWTP